MTQSSADVPVSGFSKPEGTTHKTVPVIVRDYYGNPYGPFDTALEAALWATRKWPGVDEDEWDIEALHAPD